MNQRKLIKLGNSSFAIALPKGWVDKAGLKKGDHVFLEENGGGEIIVQPSPTEAKEKKLNINLDSKDLINLRREIISGYVNGYNLISIKGKGNKETRDSVKKVIQGLIGMEIVEDHSEEIMIKDLFNVDEIDIYNFIRRVDNNLKEMFDMLAECIKKGKISQTEFVELNKIDEDVNKFHLLVSRILSISLDNPSILSRLKLKGLSLINDWWFSFNLEHIGDEIKSVCKIIKNEELLEEDRERVLELVIKLRKVYDNSLEFFYSKDFVTEDALNISREGKVVWEEFNKLTLSKNTSLAKISMKLKEIEASIYQNIKMVLNMRI